MAMEKEKILGVFQDIVCDLEIVGSNELDRELWHYYGNGLWNKLVSNKFLLVEFLESEFHSNHRLSPCVSILRDCLWKVINALPFPWEVGNTEVYDAFTDLSDKCKEWLKWIDQYFPPEQSKQGQDNEESVKQDNKPKRVNAAAKKLTTPELQAVKQELVDAELINDGGWAGSPAEFGCLVQELLEQYNVANNGGRAWTDCAEWAGYTGSIQAARNAIDANPNTRGGNAETIRRICKKK